MLIGLILYSEPHGSTQRPLLCSGPAVLCEQAAGFFRFVLRVEFQKTTAVSFHQTKMNWNLVEHQATATWADTSAIVDTLDLRNGLTVGSGAWQGSTIGALPTIQPASSAASVETYVRGADLVTTHPATKERPTRVQLYWRRWHDLPSSKAAVLELIVSVQTHLLDSDPALVIESRFSRGQDATCIDGKCEVTEGTSLALILTHPNDAVEIEMLREPGSPAGCLVRQTLFQRRLEKGVILRGRVLFCWSSEKLESEAVEQIQNRFVKAEPILTA